MNNSQPVLKVATQLEGNRKTVLLLPCPQQQIQQPAQIIVKDSDNKTVTVPENQMVIRKYSYSPVREFFVFALGGGIGVLFGRKFSL